MKSMATAVVVGFAISQYAQTRAKSKTQKKQHTFAYERT